MTKFTEQEHNYVRWFLHHYFVLKYIKLESWNKEIRQIKTFSLSSDRKFHLACQKHWWMWIIRPGNLEYKKWSHYSSALHWFESRDVAVIVKTYDVVFLRVYWVPLKAKSMSILKYSRNYFQSHAVFMYPVVALAMLSLVISNQQVNSFHTYFSEGLFSVKKYYCPCANFNPKHRDLIMVAQ